MCGFACEYIRFFILCAMNICVGDSVIIRLRDLSHVPPLLYVFCVFLFRLFGSLISTDLICTAPCHPTWCVAHIHIRLLVSTHFTRAGKQQKIRTWSTGDVLFIFCFKFNLSAFALSKMVLCSFLSLLQCERKMQLMQNCSSFRMNYFCVCLETVKSLDKPNGHVCRCVWFNWLSYFR